MVDHGQDQIQTNDCLHACQEESGHASNDMFRQIMKKLESNSDEMTHLVKRFKKLKAKIDPTVE